MNRPPTALIADDEPLLRDELAGMLARAWPELQVVALARNGREAIERFEALQPDVCFLDVHMPGISGVQAAQVIGRRAHRVFVTAYDQYAVQAFAQGVLDYVVKPVQAERLAETVARLQERLAVAQPAPDHEALLRQIAALLPAAPQRPALPPPAPEPLRYLRASVGGALKLVRVDLIDYLRADTKYTLVAWRSEQGQAAEALLSTPLKELLAQLDPACFVQVHRSAAVNLAAVSHVVRGAHETAEIHLKGRSEKIPVSRSHLHLFKPA
jgi:DNA-binding LytR/AlgR family response regulator